MALQLLGVQPVRENLMWLQFSEPPYFSGLLDPGDASNPDYYTITVVSGSIGGDDQPVRLVSPGIPEVSPDGQGICLWLDRLMSPYPGQYVVTVSNLVGTESGLPLDPSYVSANCDALAAAPVVQDRSRTVGGADFANPQSGASAGDNVPVSVGGQINLGTYQVNAKGDYASDSGLSNYRKRVIRRITSNQGTFAHLANYGAGPRSLIKKPDRAGRAETLAKVAETQVLMEPDTASVTVTVVRSSSSPGIVVLKVVALHRSGQVLDVSVPIVTG